MKLARLRDCALVLSMTLGAAGAASAQRVIKLVVPYAAGASLDTVARSFNNELGQALGATVIVENRAGAGGTIGTTAVAKATDNNTLLMTAASHNISALLYRNPGYDPIKDFAPVAYVGSSGFVVAVPSNLGVSNLQDYIKLLKANPGKLNYTSAGNGGATHLGMAAFLSRAGADMQHIPMKATGEAVTQVLAGNAQGTVAAPVAVVGFANDPKIKLLAYTGPKRSAQLPNVPTVAESGLPGFQYDTWFGVLAPASMPKAEVEKMHVAMDKVLADPVVQGRLARLGLESGTMPIDELGKLLKSDLDSTGALIKSSGARIE